MKSIITLFILSTCSFLYAQVGSADWAPIVEHSDFSINGLKQNCSKPTTGINKEYVFLEFTNKSTEPIKLTYKIEKWYDGVCSNCEGNVDDSVFSVELKAGEIISGDCDNYRNRNLAVFSKMTGSKSQARKLTSYKIIPLTLNGEKL